MGNFEKLVVLTVLFLSAIVLAVSLSGDETPDANSPFDAAARAAGVEDETSGSTNERLLMSAEGASSAGASSKKGETTPNLEPGSNLKPAPRKDGASTKRDTATSSTPSPSKPAIKTNAQGHPQVLRTAIGLTASLLDDYMVYTPRENETWSLLATRFYDSATYVPLLRAANEDLQSPRPGEAILVPVYDFRAAPKDHTPREAAPARALSATPREAQPARSTRAARSGGDSYEVVEGDNLWKIADKVYGSGARWTEIYEANKGLLPDPDALKLGMQLSIPQ